MQSPEDKKRQTLERAADYKPSSGASAHPDATAPQNENMSFSEMLAAEFKSKGHDLSDVLVEV